MLVQGLEESKDHERSEQCGVGPYNSNTVVVNVSSLVKLLLKLGVTLARPRI